MKVEKVNYIQIMVEDPEKAIEFFTDLFGTEFTDLHENKELDGRLTMSRTLGIELLSPLTLDGPVARALERRGEGLSMLSLKVPNVEEAAAEMESKGIRRIGPLRKSAALFHPKDSYGVMIELLESDISQGT